MAVPAPRRPAAAAPMSAPEPPAASERRLSAAAQRGRGGLRGAVRAALAARLPHGLAGRPRRRGGGGHRAGGVHRRPARARPLRPAAAVRAVAEPDRRQPRDRLRPLAALHAVPTRRPRRRGARRGAEAGRTTSCARSRSYRSDQRAVVVMRQASATRRARSRELLGLPRGTVNSRLRRAWTRSGRCSMRAEDRLRDAVAPRRGGRARAGARAAAESTRAGARPWSRRPPRRAPCGRGAVAVLALLAALARPAARSPLGPRGRRPPAGAPAPTRAPVADRPALRRPPAAVRRRRDLDRRARRQAPAARRLDRGVVVAARALRDRLEGRRLAALDRRGQVRWSLTARGRSPARSGPRAASASRTARASGLRVVAGDGSGDRCSTRGRSAPPRGGRAARTCSPTRPAATSTSSRPTRPPPRAASSSPRAERLALVGRRRAAVREPAPLARDLRRSRPAHRPHLDAGPPTVTAFTPARGGWLVAVARRDRTSSEVVLMRPADPTACCSAPTGASPACASLPAAAGCSSPGRSPTSGSTCAPAPVGANRVLAAPR